MGLSILVGEDGKGIYLLLLYGIVPKNQTLDERTMTYYDETIQTSARRILPLLSYFHQDSRPDKFEELPYRSSAIYGKCNSKFNR